MKTKIKYRHYRVPSTVTKPSGRPPELLLQRTLFCWGDLSPRGGKTECSIEFYDEFGTLLGKVTGYAYCSMSDTYVKSIGRKLAFDRAMKLYQYA